MNDSDVRSITLGSFRNCWIRPLSQCGMVIYAAVPTYIWGSIYIPSSIFRLDDQYEQRPSTDKSARGWTRTTGVSLLQIYSLLPSLLGILWHIKGGAWTTRTSMPFYKQLSISNRVHYQFCQGTMRRRQGLNLHTLLQVTSD